MADEREVATAELAAQAASEIGFPVVAKLCGDAIAHKTERGLVRLKLASAQAVQEAAADLLAAAGIEEPRRVLAPLLGASLDNALRLGDQALTGPVARGDAATVEAHLAVLKNQSELAAASYRALARVTADRAVDAGLLSAALAEALLGVLSEGGESV